MSFRALAEKSPAVKTRTNAHVTRRDEGVPPYRRPRRESDTMSFRALAEKSPTGETEPNISAPAYLPAAARRREIPYGRNGTNRTRTNVKIAVCRRYKRSPSGIFPRSLPFPRNDILLGRVRRLMRIIILIKAYTRTVLSLRGAQSATRQSPGREDESCGHGRYTSTVGDFSTAFGLSSSLRSK